MVHQLHILVFFLFFLENRIWHFMQIVSWGDNLHEVSKFCLQNFLPSMQSVKLKFDTSDISEGGSLHELSSVVHGLFIKKKSWIVHELFINYGTIHKSWTIHESVFHELFSSWTIIHGWIQKPFMNCKLSLKNYSWIRFMNSSWTVHKLINPFLQGDVRNLELKH